MKLLRSVVFVTVLLFVSAYFLFVFIRLGSAAYATVWGGMAGFAVMDLFRAIHIHGGKYKALQLLSCSTTAMVALSSYLTYSNYENGNYLVMLYWLALAVVNVFLVYSQRRTFKATVELDKQIADHFAKYFPEGQDDDIKLELK